MITLLPAGPGTLNLVRALRSFSNDSDLAVIAQTADTLWQHGGHLAPGLDAALYLFEGMLNTRTWAGVKGDTYTTRRFMERAGGTERIPVGDKERAVQIVRAELIRQGHSLTAATDLLCGSFGIAATILPATDDEVTVVAETDAGPMHLLEYQAWGRETRVLRRMHPSFARPPRATPKVIECIETSDAVIIGPDAPFSHVVPVLICEGMREVLEEAFVIAISPFRPNAAFCDETASLLEAEGLLPDSRGVFAVYGEYIDLFVQDTGDPVEVEGALRLDTGMAGRGRAESLAWDLMAVIRRRSRR